MSEHKKEKNTIKNTGRYYLFRILLAFRWLVRLFTGVMMLGWLSGAIIFAFGIKSMFEAIIFAVLAIINFIIYIEYDRLILLIKPDDYDVWL